MSWLDLHMHSSESMDGELSPEEVVSIAKKAGVMVMAICDHNITTGVKRGVEAAKNAGINFSSIDVLETKNLLKNSTKTSFFIKNIVFFACFSALNLMNRVNI